MFNDSTANINQKDVTYEQDDSNDNDETNCAQNVQIARSRRLSAVIITAVPAAFAPDAPEEALDDVGVDEVLHV